MSEFSIRPNVISIARSKRKFIYLGISLLIINFGSVAQYFRLISEGQSFGYYLFILALVNLPILIVSIVLLLVPLMYKKHYENVSYTFKESCMVIQGNNVNISDLNRLDEVEFTDGFYNIYLGSYSDCYELYGISESDLTKIKDWFEKKKV